MRRLVTYTTYWSRLLITSPQIKAITNKEPLSKGEDIPRIYALHKYGPLACSMLGMFKASRYLTDNRNFYQMRLDRIRNAEIAKRNRERLKNPSVFPSVPAGGL